MGKKDFSLVENKFIIYGKVGDSSVLTLEEKVKASYGKIRDFFDADLKKDIVIQLVYSRAEMNKCLGGESHEWFIGFAHKDGKTIVVFSPSKVEEHSPHKKEEIPKIITHELVHIFINSLGYTPWWLDEGLALYLADQPKQNGKEHLRKLFEGGRMFEYSKNNYNFCMSNGGYEASKFITEHMLKDLGKTKTKKLIKNNCTSQDFNDYFKKIIKISPQDYIRNILFN